MESRGRGLFFLLLLLSGAAGMVLATAARRMPVRAEPFQRLVGGLGFGPQLDLSSGASSFDPRLDGSRSMDYGPIPGGACLSAGQEDSVLFYPPLGHQFRLPDEKGD